MATQHLHALRQDCLWDQKFYDLDLPMLRCWECRTMASFFVHLPCCDHVICDKCAVDRTETQADFTMKRGCPPRPSSVALMTCPSCKTTLDEVEMS